MLAAPREQPKKLPKGRGTSGLGAEAWRYGAAVHAYHLYVGERSCMRLLFLHLALNVGLVISGSLLVCTAC